MTCKTNTKLTLRSSVSAGSKRRETVSRTSYRNLATITLICGLLFTIPACSGGGFNPGGGVGGAALAAALGAAGGGGGVTDVVATTTNETIVRIDFQVTGNSGQTFDVALKYFEDLNGNNVQDLPAEPAFAMTQASAALEMSDPDVGASTVGAQMMDANGNFSGTFFWHAAMDLGFVQADYGVLVCVTSNDPNQVINNGASGAGDDFSFTGGNPSIVSAGSIGAAGTAGGRSEHTSHNVSGLNSPASATDLGSEILIAGGRDNGGPINNIDRFSLDFANRTHMANGTFTATAAERIDHASATFLGTSGTDNNVRVLVTGGSVGPAGGTPVNSAEIYSFGPNGTAESVTGTMQNMQSSRRNHAACWLPDNRILITGGEDSAFSILNSAEVYDPLTDTFTNVPVPPGFPARHMHTHCLLPDGRVLIAGGLDGGGSPVNAYTFDHTNDTFTDTGASIDRIDHTATLLVNGICALVGGRTSGGTVLSTVDFFRPFAVTDSSGGMIAAGFTSPVKASGPFPGLVQMGTARRLHGASRLGDGNLLVSGGSSVNTMNPAALSTADLFVPSKFTDNAIGCFTLANPTMDPAFDLANARLNHTQNTTAVGSVALVGGADGGTVLDTIEVFNFNNTAPVVSNVVVSSSSATDGLIKFDLADAEGDCSFVIVRIKFNMGNFQFAALTEYQETVNLSPGTKSIRFSPAANGVSSGQDVIVEIIPFGGVMGGPVSSAMTMIN